MFGRPDDRLGCTLELIWNGRGELLVSSKHQGALGLPGFGEGLLVASP